MPTMRMQWKSMSTKKQQTKGHHTESEEIMKVLLVVLFAQGARAKRGDQVKNEERKKNTLACVGMRMANGFGQM